MTGAKTLQITASYYQSITLIYMLPLKKKDAAQLFLIIMKSAFNNLNLIVNYPVNQSMLHVNSSGPKAGIIKL